MIKSHLLYQLSYGDKCCLYLPVKGFEKLPSPNPGEKLREIKEKPEKEEQPAKRNY